MGRNEDAFRVEANELLEKIEECLLELERDPNDQQIISEVFRALHTIKGSGAMFGFPDHVHIDLTARGVTDSSLPGENRDDAPYAQHVNHRRDVSRQ